MHPRRKGQGHSEHLSPQDAPEAPPSRASDASYRQGSQISNQKFFGELAHQPHSVAAEPQPLHSPNRRRILFYHSHEPYYEFTNFSPDPIQYRGKNYPTSEHLFQSLKFLDHRPALAEHIRTFSSRPSKVFDETHRFNPEVRKDWLQVRIQMMDEVLWHKFTQNDRLVALLLSTEDAELVENSDKDAFWGVGKDGKGGNELGKALMRLRDKLRARHVSKEGDMGLGPLKPGLNAHLL